MNAAWKTEVSDRRSVIGGKSFTPTSVLRPPSSDLRSPTSVLRPPSSGFTLFELLAVITIIGIVLSVTLGSFTGWSDAQAVRGSADVVEAALAQARDYAVAHRVPVRFEYQTCVTNTFKKVAVYQLISEPNADVATNYQITASSYLGDGVESESQYIGPLQKLSGNAWLLCKISETTPTLLDGYDRFVFLPNGRVFAPETDRPLVLFVVSRKARSDKRPNIIYRIDIDPASGNATASKCNPDTPSTYSR